MSRTPIPYTNLSPNSIATPTATAIDIPNGMTVNPTNGFNASTTERSIFAVTNTAGADHIITVRAADSVLGLGTYANITLTVPAGATRYVGPFESARVQQRDGSVWFDFELGHTGTVTAFLFPKGV